MLDEEEANDEDERETSVSVRRSMPSGDGSTKMLSGGEFLPSRIVRE